MNEFEECRFLVNNPEEHQYCKGRGEVTAVEGDLAATEMLDDEQIATEKHKRDDHDTKVSPPGKQRCWTCGKMYRNQRDLRKHKQDEHDAEVSPTGKHRFWTCVKTYKNNRDLRKHKQDEHGAKVSRSVGFRAKRFFSYQSNHLH